MRMLCLASLVFTFGISTPCSAQLNPSLVLQVNATWPPAGALNVPVNELIEVVLFQPTGVCAVDVEESFALLDTSGDEVAVEWELTPPSPSSVNVNQRRYVGRPLGDLDPNSEHRLEVSLRRDLQGTCDDLGLELMASFITGSGADTVVPMVPVIASQTSDCRPAYDDQGVVRHHAIATLLLTRDPGDPLVQYLVDDDEWPTSGLVISKLAVHDLEGEFRVRAIDRAGNVSAPVLSDYLIACRPYSDTQREAARAQLEHEDGGCSVSPGRTGGGGAGWGGFVVFGMALFVRRRSRGRG